eukprot:TRINITY_DN13067_c1_g1_i2.p1 TRINITY_DN13067_c1_g1~~TRINITY_DN13067_c1_g1_i2.p1  ORF type:complete len:732 (+),score=254.89 TRINITY_DN13067_c1_g1_i2:79-2196(+)
MAQQQAPDGDAAAHLPPGWGVTEGEEPEDDDNDIAQQLLPPLAGAGEESHPDDYFVVPHEGGAGVPRTQSASSVRDTEAEVAALQLRAERSESQSDMERAARLQLQQTAHDQERLLAEAAEREKKLRRALAESQGAQQRLEERAQQAERRAGELERVWAKAQQELRGECQRRQRAEEELAAAKANIVWESREREPQKAGTDELVQKLVAAQVEANELRQQVEQLQMKLMDAVEAEQQRCAEVKLMSERASEAEQAREAAERERDEVRAAHARLQAGGQREPATAPAEDPAPQRHPPHPPLHWPKNPPAPAQQLQPQHPPQGPAPAGAAGGGGGWFRSGLKELGRKLTEAVPVPERAASFRGSAGQRAAPHPQQAAPGGAPRPAPVAAAAAPAAGGAGAAPKLQPPAGGSPRGDFLKLHGELAPPAPARGAERLLNASQGGADCGRPEGCAPKGAAPAEGAAEQRQGSPAPEVTSPPGAGWIESALARFSDLIVHQFHPETPAGAERAGTSSPSETSPSPVFIPQLSGSGPETPLTTPTLRSLLAKQLPNADRHQNWDLLYSTAVHGHSLATLRDRCGEEDRCMLIVQTVSGELCGGFSTSPWERHQGYFGNGESFVWSSEGGISADPGADLPELKIYRWSRKNDFFQLCRTEILALGGGGAPAIAVDQSLLKLTSGACETFASPPLVAPRDAVIRRVEVWAIRSR